MLQLAVFTWFSFFPFIYLSLAAYGDLQHPSKHFHHHHARTFTTTSLPRPAAPQNTRNEGAEEI